MRFDRRNVICSEALLSGFIVLFSITLLNIHKWILDKIIDQIIVLKPHTYYFNQWSNPQGNLGLEVYFFNWTNPQDFMNSSVKPSFKEIGPIVMKKIVLKSNVTFNENNTITYRNINLFYMQDELSKVKLTDNITTADLVPVYAAEQSRSWNYFFKKGIAVALHDRDFYVTRTAREWLFDGYEDNLLSTALYLPSYAHLPHRIAWFYQKNGTTIDGVINMGTGKGNTIFGQTYSWNYKNISDYKNSCGDINAPSEIFPQHIKKDKIELFVVDFCRKIVFDYNGTVQYKGIPAYKFSGGMNFIDNGKYNKKNTCFCYRKCLKFGVVDYSQCKYGLPSYLSLPHFHGADPKYRDDIEGMNPNPIDPKHNMEIILEPRTGTVLSMSFGTQMNLYLERNPDMSKFANIREVMIPLLWFWAGFELDKTNLTLILMSVHGSTFFICVAYLLIALVIVRYIIKFLRRKNKMEKGIENRQLEGLNLITHKNCCDKPRITSAYI